MIRALVLILYIAAALFGLAVILGWRPGPPDWWDDEDHTPVNLGHVRRESAAPEARPN